MRGEKQKERERRTRQAAAFRALYYFTTGLLLCGLFLLRHEPHDALLLRWKVIVFENGRRFILRISAFEFSMFLAIYLAFFDCYLQISVVLVALSPSCTSGIKELLLYSILQMN